MSKLRLLFSSYILVIIGLFFYSFTQVDLSLTLSRLSIYQILEKQLQYIGFYQRPFSAIIFTIIASFLFIFYLSFLYFSKKEQITKKLLSTAIFLTFVALVFSYNAFSYDLFNYIFDAKILTFYNQNPYFHKPLEYVDSMLNFMRWTHRFYPYGPSWLVLTVPLSYVGSNIFLLTFFLFKILIGLTYLGSSILIYKISEIVFPKEKIFNTIFFAFNPLVIIEGLVSAHNDFPLVFFGLLAIYLYLQKKKAFSFFSLLFSIGIKYSTAALLPIFALIIYFEKTKKTINWEKLFLLSVLLSLCAIFLATLRTTFQPWYLIFPFSLCAFISKKYYIFIPVFVSSVFAILIYVTYVFMTDYAKGYSQIVANIEWLGLFLAIALTLVFILKTKMFSKH